MTETVTKFQEIDKIKGGPGSHPVAAFELPDPDGRPGVGDPPVVPGWPVVMTGNLSATIDTNTNTQFYENNAMELFSTSKI